MNFEKVLLLLQVNALHEQRKVNTRYNYPNLSLICLCIGMTFQVSMGFSGLDNPDGKDDQSKTYALFLGDTVVVNEVKNPRKCVGIFFQGTVLE